MLVCYPRRQDMHHLQPHPPLDLPSPSPSRINFFDSQSYSTCTPSPYELNEKLLRNYFDSTSYSHTPIAPFSDQSHQYMSSAYEYDSPAIRIQQSTPVPQLPLEYLQQPMSVADNGTFQNWNYNYNNGQMSASPSLQTPIIKGRRRSHQRIPSNSSAASSSPASPYSQGHAPSLSYTASAEHSPSVSSMRFESSYNADQPSQKFSNHLPTPTHTPTTDTFLSQQYQTYAPQNFNYAKDASVAMTQAMENQSVGEDDVPGFSHSGRHSVSSYGHESPATPHTAGDDYEYKQTTNGENFMLKIETWMDEYLQVDDELDVPRAVPPKFERTETDVCADLGFNPYSAAQIPTSAPPTIKTDSSMLSPYRSAVNGAVNAQLLRAYNARSQSPPNRAVSPFRQGSPLAPTSHSFESPQPRLGRADQTRERQKAEADAIALQQHITPAEEEPVKTISPKEAMLDYNESEEDSKMPLFPGSGSEYEAQYASANSQYSSDPSIKYEAPSEQNYSNMAAPNGANWTTTQPSISMVYPTSSAPQSNFNFAPPSIPGSMHGLPHGLPHGYRQVTSASSAPEETPEFPAHLTSMESSASEAPPSSNNSNNDVPIQKPAGTTADSGTYTCTYHGCTLRFETPQKLQKHKREGHRQSTTASTPGVGSGMTSAALLARNTQAGPHKCERINPTTGKPCNTIFSRPYDLTRHEDTIHNARKQKVRCALCVEEKTFSRNDALTRHMRVVHPEVDFPGKHRRRGGSSE